MEGDVEGVMRRPPDDAPDTEETRAEREKWDAWHSQSGLSRTAAKRAYISTLIETMHRYASSTPETRELVAELEFVWDQIKANSNVTSHESSPTGGGTTRRMSYATLGGSRRKTKEDEGDVEGREGLTVLRPVGDEDDEEDFDDEDYEEDDTAGRRELRDLDIRNRKWRERIEAALVKTSTEVAALREQIEARRIGGPSMYGKGSGAWPWIRWLVWVCMRQLLLDTVILGLAYLWVRRKGDRRLEQGLGLVMQAVKEQLKEIKGLRSWRLRGMR